MPIKINADINSVVNNKKLYTPKYFSKDITGSGKTSGMLCQAISPSNLPISTPENIVSEPYWRIRTDVNKYVKTTRYPLNPLGSYSPVGSSDYHGFDASWCLLPTVNPVASKTGQVYAMLTPMSLSITESTSSVAATTDTSNDSDSDAVIAFTGGKKCSILYRLAIIDVEDNNGDKTWGFTNDVYYTENPAHTFADLQFVSSQDIAAFDAYLASYDVYYEICKLSELWQTKLPDIILEAYDKNPDKFPMSHIMRYISQYKVSLQQYKQLYIGLKQRFNDNDLRTLTKINTSLLLQNTLDNLATAQFPALPAPGNTNKQLDLSWCSKEQFDAITSAAPLNLVQAGAGTGKSTVIKSRLDYLDYLGIDLNKVMVLSFTNAAADNIKARCPRIQSMTIARMIDTIYTKNHPNHQLSPSLTKRGEGSTFTNSLKLYQTMPLVPELIKATENVEKRNDYAGLLRLVEENYDDIMNILDTVKQTTFQLEIIICYLEHATVQIPFDIEHLLIDEVQDNAIFEFIFFLNLTGKLHNHLYLVGDCSQTLYEFRASDPKALNAIENSGLFATYPLNINYRSNQDVLQFANELLNDIEANQYANIQLQAYKINNITKQSFEEHVAVNYTRLNRISEAKDHVYRTLRDTDLRDWIDDKLNKHEQICVLAYKRREAAFIQTELEKLYPNKSFVSIIPAKNTAFAYFSKYVSECNTRLMALPLSNVTDLCNHIRSEIITNLGNCGINPSNPKYTQITGKVYTMLKEWEEKNKNLISDTIVHFNAGYISHNECIQIIANSLINFEIQKNALKQSLMSQKNADKKENTDTADFIFSTIHSAKGLEFDNCIVLYQNKNQMEEDAKRMYYVALTRAKKSEYIIAYDTVLDSLISARYNTILQRLPDANAAMVI